MKSEFIYVLVDPDTHLVRYVGRTCKPLAKRLRQHIWTARRGKNTPLCAWIRSIEYRPVIVLLQTVEYAEITLDDGIAENTVSAAEIKWLKRFERAPLTNQWIDRDSRAYKRLTNR